MLFALSVRGYFENNSGEFRRCQIANSESYLKDENYSKYTHIVKYGIHNNTIEELTEIEPLVPYFSKFKPLLTLIGHSDFDKVAEIITKNQRLEALMIFPNSLHGVFNKSSDRINLISELEKRKIDFCKFNIGCDTYIGFFKKKEAILAKMYIPSSLRYEIFNDDMIDLVFQFKKILG